MKRVKKYVGIKMQYSPSPIWWVINKYGITSNDMTLPSNNLTRFRTYTRNQTEVPISRNSEVHML